MPRSREQVSVYNPNDFPVDVITYNVTITNEEVDVVITIPPRSWKILYMTDDLLLKMRIYGLTTGTGDGSIGPGGLDGLGTYIDKTTGDFSNAVKGHYEDLVEITTEIIVLGYFTTAKIVQMYHFDSTEFIPVNGPQQIYGLDYTMKNVNGLTRVMFLKSLQDGPKNGLGGILAVGDSVSFRYVSEGTQGI